MPFKDEERITRNITLRKRAPGNSDACTDGSNLICKYAPKCNSKICDDDTNTNYFLWKRPDLEVDSTLYKLNNFPLLLSPGTKCRCK